MNAASVHVSIDPSRFVCCAKQGFTASNIRDWLILDERSATFYWRKKPVSKTDLSISAGSISKYRTNSYVRIYFQGRHYAAHRLMWLWYHGAMPKRPLEIDHINGNGLDNRIANLRLVTRRENCQNKKRHREGKLIGAVHNSVVDKWEARIHENGKQRYIGLFDTEREAHEAYMERLNEIKVKE